MSEQSQLTKGEQDLIRHYGTLQRAISDLGNDIQAVLNLKNTRIRELEAQIEALKKLDSLAQAAIEQSLTPRATRDQ